MAYYGGFPKYVTVAERKAKAEKKIASLRKKDQNISPVIIEGRKIAKTWWGEAWNKNLEKYSDYSNRIGRGRSYVRHGAVLDLKIQKGDINALVLGSGSRPYKINIKVKPITQKMWMNITKESAGKIESLQELVEGNFPKSLQELFIAKGKGLFPSPKEIELNCNCPDCAKMCKHLAAVLYGVGARLDENPKLFFELRNINIDDIISEAVNKKSKTLLEKSKIKSNRVIDESDIFDMFGIENK